MKLLERGYRAALGKAWRAAAQAFASQRPKKYYLAACLCFKDAAPYLEEWLEFHLVVGVEHFYLYNNESADHYAEILRPYLDAGVVTVKDWAGSGQQARMYEDCVKLHRTEARWIAFIDEDEFLFPAMGRDLKERLTVYEEFGGVGVCRYFYGSSGHTAQPMGLVIENYTRRTAVPGQKVKSIVNPMDVKFCAAHSFGFRRGVHAVDELLNMLPGADVDTPSVAHLCINHYFTRSFEEYTRKIDKGRVSRVGKRRMPDENEWLEAEAGRNAVEDRQILQFLPELQARLEQRRKNATRRA